MRQIRSFLFFFLLLLTACGSGNEAAREEPESTKPVDQENSDPIGGQNAGDDRKAIVFFGNSLSAGYGLDTEQSFPSLIQDRLDSLGYPYKVVNAGVSGETTSGGSGRIDWVLSQPVDVFILELGGNDGLRGIPPAETRRNLQEIIDKVKAKYPDAEIILAGMEAPPNMGSEFTSEFRNIYPELAAENDVELIPFLLQDVGGVPELNQPDGIHPNAAGAKIVAENVWEVLEGVISL